MPPPRPPRGGRGPAQRDERPRKRRRRRAGALPIGTAPIPRKSPEVAAGRQRIASRRPAGQCRGSYGTGPTITDTADISPGIRTGCLRILGTTDLHGAVIADGWGTGRPAEPRGLAVLAPMIRAARAEAGADSTLLVDSGDMLQGTPLADLAMESPGDDPHPVIAAMTALGYDAAALGNHDFNFGLATLQAILARAGFPVLCANLVRAAGATPLDDRPFVPPRILLHRQVAGADGRRHPVRVGLVAAAPPQTLLWDADLLQGHLTARGIVETVAAHAAALRAEGADLVVVLCHSGLGAPPADPADPAATDPRAEDASLAVAALPDVDVVLCGHRHQRHPATPGGAVAGTAKPLVMAGAHGSDLAVIDLHLVAGDDPANPWRLAGHRAELRPAAAAAPPADAALADLVRPARARTLAALDRVVGHAPAPLHAAFPLAAHAPALQFLADAQAAEARRLAAGTPLAGLPLVSAAAFTAGGLAGPEAFVILPPGPIRERDLWRISPFPNRVCALPVTGRLLRAWLERAAACLATIRPGDSDVPLVAPGAAGYMFDVLFGLSYTIDPSRPARTDPATGAPRPDPGPGRITRLHHAGRPVADDDRFLLATTGYRAGGGSGYPAIPAEAPRLWGSTPLRRLLAEHAAAGPLALEPRPAWDFARLGATALLEAAPFACAVTHGDPTRRLDPVGPGPGGFARFRLHL